jgi:hypothetical protein
MVGLIIPGEREVEGERQEINLLPLGERGWVRVLA